MKTPSQALVLLGHGSRDPLWQRPMQAVQALVQARRPGVVVRCAFLELCPPDLASVIGQLAGSGLLRVGVVPLFLGAGRHVREDLPELVQAMARLHPGVHFRLMSPIGEDPRLLALIAEIAAEATAHDNGMHNEVDH